MPVADSSRPDMRLTRQKCEAVEMTMRSAGAPCSRSILTTSPHARLPVTGDAGQNARGNPSGRYAARAHSTSLEQVTPRIWTRPAEPANPFNKQHAGAPNRRAFA
jgi:hypothetical protein